MEKNLKDIIANGRGNWLGKEEDKQDSQKNNCYKGLFWDLETREFLRWNQFKQECKSTESSDQ
jgi:hypothetical protein